MFRLKSRVLRAVGAATAVIAVWPAPVEARTHRVAYKTECGITDVSIGATRCTYTFPYTRNVETFVVPPTTEPVEITAMGAPGGGDAAFRSRGANVTGSFSNLGGMPIFVTVGGEGWFDGYNGGGPGGGGGASDLRLASPQPDRGILGAGGGGGLGGPPMFDAGPRRLPFQLVEGGDVGPACLRSRGE